MSNKLHLIILALLLLATLLNGFGIFNTMVSMKNELANPTDCISTVTGSDLCKILKAMKLLTTVFGIVFLLFALIQKRIVRK